MEYDGHPAATLEGLAERLEGKATLFENFGRRYSLLPDTAIATLASAGLQKEHVSGPIIRRAFP